MVATITGALQFEKVLTRRTQHTDDWVVVREALAAMGITLQEICPALIEAIYQRRV